jgi:hypothetical protein
LSLILRHRGSIFSATAMVAVSEKTNEIAVAHTAFRMIDGVVFHLLPLGLDLPRRLKLADERTPQYDSLR